MGFPPTFSRIEGYGSYPLHKMYADRHIRPANSFIIVDSLQGSSALKAIERWTYQVNHSHVLMSRAQILSKLLMTSERQIGFIFDKEGKNIDLALIPVGQKDYLMFDLPREITEETEAPHEYLLLGKNPVRLTMDGDIITMEHEIRNVKHEKIEGKMTFLEGRVHNDVTVTNKDGIISRSVNDYDETHETTLTAKLNHLDRSRIHGINLTRTVTATPEGRQIQMSPSVSINVARDGGNVISLIGGHENARMTLMVDTQEAVSLSIHDALNQEGVGPRDLNVALLGLPNFMLPQLAERLHNGIKNTTAEVNWSKVFFKNPESTVLPH